MSTPDVSSLFMSAVPQPDGLPSAQYYKILGVQRHATFDEIKVRPCIEISTLFAMLASLQAAAVLVERPPTPGHAAASRRHRPTDRPSAVLESSPFAETDLIRSVMHSHEVDWSAVSSNAS